MTRYLFRSAVVPCVAAFATVVLASPGYAWGQEGHRVIALIAAHQLSPRARAGVAILLADDAERGMEEISPWADEIRRSRRETGPWHYVDIPLSAPAYNAQRDCPLNKCIVVQVEHELNILANRRLVSPIRAEALRFLIHFVGDIHQPLHASDNDDRGGNEVGVYFGGRRTNLHSLWDTQLVQHLGRDPDSLASSLEQGITADLKNQWSKGGPSEWATETHSVARQSVYSDILGRGEPGAPIILPPDYASQKALVIRLQLARAGTRLAWVLNRAFR